MNINKKSAIGALVAGLALAVPAVGFAQQVVDKGVYFGGSTGKARYQKTCTGVTVSCEETPYSWKVLAGYQLGRNLSVEFGYSDLGQAKADGTTINFTRTVTAWDVSLLGGPSFGEHLKAYGRIGFTRAETQLRGTFSGSVADVNEKSSSFTYGLGVQYDITRHFGVRAEWQRYAQTGGDKIKPFLTESDKENIDVASVGLIVKF